MRPELVKAYERVYLRDLLYTGEIRTDNSRILTEGMAIQVSVNRYERSREARDRCIAYRGSRCMVCKFSFEDVYGPVGKNMIQVHHLIPLSRIQREYEVDPVGDLCPVCPNCHLIIHCKKEPFALDEVRAMIVKSRNQT